MRIGFFRDADLTVSNSAETITEGIKMFKPVIEAWEVRCLLSVSPFNPEALSIAECASVQLVSSEELIVNFGT